MRRRLLSVSGLIVIAAVGLQAQWLHYPTSGIPRTADGKPKMDAPAPRTADGRTDLSGMWQPANYTYLRNIMADLRPEDVPFQPSAARAYEARLAKDDPAVRCRPAGIPRSLNNLFKMVTSPGVVTVLYEGTTTFREIFTDGRTLPENQSPTWYGYAIGRWEGDVFVVESAGYNDKTWLDFAGHGHTELLHVTERYRRKDFGHMDVEVTIDDAGAYTRPITITYPLLLTPDTDFLESICENDVDILPRLVGTNLSHPPTRKSIVIAPESLAHYAGTYELSLGRNIIVTASQDRLLMQYPGNPETLTLFAETTSRFFITTREETIEFQTGSDGAVASLVIQGVTPNQPLRKLR